MTEFVHLLGTEHVQNAANRMSEAAHEMNRAAGNIEYSLDQFKRFMDEWLAKFEQILSERTPGGAA